MTGLLRKYADELRDPAKFRGIAHVLMNRCLWMINGRTYRICEIEFYLHSDTHVDRYTHGNADQETFGNYYFHQHRNRTYKSGTYKGMDITLGAKGAPFGVLVRAIFDIERKELIRGPCKCVDRILREYGVQTIHELTRGGALLSAWANSRRLCLIDTPRVSSDHSETSADIKKSPSSAIYTMPRIGLSDAHQEWRDAPYRFVHCDYIRSSMGGSRRGDAIIDACTQLPKVVLYLIRTFALSPDAVLLLSGKKFDCNGVVAYHMMDPIFRYMMSRNWTTRKFDTVDVCCALLRHGAPEFLLREFVLGNGGDRYDDWFYDAAIDGKSLRSLGWLADNGFIVEPENVQTAVESGSIDIMQWFHDRGCRMPEDALTTAIGRDDVVCAKWLHHVGYPIDECALEVAVAGCGVEMVKWVCGLGFPLSEKIMTLAMRGGMMEVIEFLCDRKCPIPADIMGAAILTGNEELAQYLHSFGAAIPVDAFAIAFKTGNIKMWDWVYEHGGRPSADTFTQITRDYTIAQMQWLVDHGCSPPVDMLDTAIEWKRTDVIEWIIRRGHPCSPDEMRRILPLYTSSAALRGLHEAIGLPRPTE